jgi:GGDEF domain-containing protein
MDVSASRITLVDSDPCARGWAGLWAAFTVLAIAGVLSLSAWSQRGPDSTGFVAIVGCITAVAYLATAYLLSNRLVISRSPALILLAATYLLCGLAVGIHTFTYPGVAPQWWKSGPEATLWFWVVWHAAAALGIILFVALDDEWTHRQTLDVLEPAARDVAARVSLGDAGAFMRGPLLLAVTLMAGSAVWLWRDPRIFARWFGAAILPPALIGLLLILDLTAIVLLGFALRRDNIVRTWLLLAAVASLLDVAAMSWSAGPFTTGWYFSQACALVAASVLPIVLLGDLRARLCSADGRAQLEPSLLDAATGVANELGLIVQLRRIAQLAARSSASLAIAVVAVDNAAAAVPVLQRLFRASDVIGRIGAAEFAVILTPGSEPDLRWLRRRMDAEVRRGTAVRGLGLRIGVAECDPTGRPVRDLLDEGLRSARSKMTDVTVDLRPAVDL